MPALGDDAPLPLLLRPPGIAIPLSSLREHPPHEAAMTTMRRIFVNVLTIVISTRMARTLSCVRLLDLCGRRGLLTDRCIRRTLPACLK
jgi:hypothetical protein